MPLLLAFKAVKKKPPAGLCALSFHAKRALCSRIKNERTVSVPAKAILGYHNDPLGLPSPAWEMWSLCLTPVTQRA